MQRADELQYQQQSLKALSAYTRALGDVVALETKLRHAATQAQLVEDLAKLAAAHEVRVVSENYEEGRGRDAPLPAVRRRRRAAGRVEPVALDERNIRNARKRTRCRHCAARG